MRTVWIDEAFCCHVQEAPGLRPVETAFFDGKCDAFVEGYRYIPRGESRTGETGTVFGGEMIAPWRPFPELDALQREHERRLLAEYADALKELGVEA